MDSRGDRQIHPCMEPMTDAEVRTMVDGSWFGTLAVARSNRAYAIPIFYGHLDDTFYFHSLPGLKDDYIEATEEACLTIVRAESEDRWASVMALGPVEPVTMEQEKVAAMDALMGVPLPPAEGTTESGAPKRGDTGLIYRKLTPRELHGRKSVPPPMTLTDAA